MITAIVTTVAAIVLAVTAAVGIVAIQTDVEPVKSPLYNYGARQ
ncbi:MAG TPA: hypothetical protein VEZ46_03135 [Mycobacteriales bacterium]|nr:hypothetical protein [Mycobacteriales bacterium]